MMISTLEFTKAERRRHCPQCGHPIASRRRFAWIENALGILAIVAVVLLLAAMGLLVSKARAAILSDREPHSILFYPLEDWTRY